tara:strand:+ start:12884 stop:13144 length:261 start_codon:yes stop_codon:yes gene_type:complete
MILRMMPIARNPTVKLAMLSVTPNTVFSTSMMCSVKWSLLDLIQSPNFSCESQMATWVNGLLIQQTAIAIGMLALALTLARPASSI